MEDEYQRKTKSKTDKKVYQTTETSNNNRKLEEENTTNKGDLEEEIKTHTKTRRNTNNDNKKKNENDSAEKQEDKKRRGIICRNGHTYVHNRMESQRLQRKGWKSSTKKPIKSNITQITRNSISPNE
jgi:hypothetical protein